MKRNIKCSELINPEEVTEKEIKRIVHSMGMDSAFVKVCYDMVFEDGYDYWEITAKTDSYDNRMKFSQQIRMITIGISIAKTEMIDTSSFDKRIKKVESTN